MSDLLEAALRLAGRGMPVFPLCPKTKIPFEGSKGCLDATTDADKISAWWKREPESNIGPATGQRSGVFVLDVDIRKETNGEATLQKHEEEFGALPATVEVLTPSTGRHIYFRMPTFDVPCGNGRLGTGLDIKASGGYMLVPPSYVVEKTYRGSYRMSVDSAKQLASAPAWLLQMTATKGPKAPTYWAETVAGVGEGARHETFVSWAGKLIGMGLHQADVHDFLTWLNSRFKPPKDNPKEIENAIAFALKRELAR